MDGGLGGEATHLFLALPGVPVPLLVQLYSATLDVWLRSILRLPEAVERLQEGLDVTPDANIQGEGIPQFGVVVAHTNDHASLLEAQINRAAPSALPIADAAHHVIGLFRERVNRADIIRVLDWETAIVKRARRHW